MSVTEPTITTSPPRDGLVRMLPDLGLRAAAEDAPDEMPTLAGRFAVFNEWTEINSLFEGHFMERFAPGAFKKTISESRDSMRVLFQHGQDPQIGDKPLGPIADIREEDDGAHYEVPLLDTAYNRELVPGLKAGLYGASFRFGVVREKIEQDPEPSDHNPKGLPERTVTEARVAEFGPVTFPAYPTATAGLRSMTDDFCFARFAGDPARLAELLASTDVDLERLAELLTAAAPRAQAPIEEDEQQDAPSTDDADLEVTPEDESRETEQEDAGSTTAPGYKPTPLDVTAPNTKRRGVAPWL